MLTFVEKGMKSDYHALPNKFNCRNEIWEDCYINCQYLQINKKTMKKV